MDSIFRNAAGQYPTKMSNKLTDDIRAQFKSARGLEKKSMNKVLLGFIHQYLAEKETPPSTSRKEGE